MRAWVKVAAAGVATLVGLILVDPYLTLSTGSTEFNGACLRHRHCSRHWYDPAQTCRVFTDEQEALWSHTKRALPPEQCSGEWLEMTSSRQTLFGRFCRSRPRGGPATAVFALEQIHTEEARPTPAAVYQEKLAREMSYLALEYHSGSCNGASTEFEANHFTVALVRDDPADCWVIDENGLRPHLGRSN